MIFKKIQNYIYCKPHSHNWLEIFFNLNMYVNLYTTLKTITTLQNLLRQHTSDEKATSVLANPLPIMLQKL